MEDFARQASEVSSQAMPEKCLLHGFRHLQHFSEHAMAIQVLRHYT
jgi:hypothetical protein